MKKIIIILIVIVLFIPSIVTAEDKLDMENHPEEMVGCWGVFIPVSVNYGFGDESIYLILNHDGTMAFSIAMNKTETKETQQVDYTGIWTFYIDCVIFKIDGRDTYGIWEYTDDMLWFKLDTMSFGLKKLPDFEASQMKYIGDKE